MSYTNWDNLKPKNCLRCGKSFVPNNPRRMYCSDVCRSGKSTCSVCGKEFVKKGNTTGQYCSPDCWYKSGDAKLYPDRECPICHKTFDAKHPDQKYCGRDCTRLGLRKRDSERLCKNCGKSIPYHHYKKVYCSPECRKEGIAHTWKKSAKSIGSKRPHPDGYVLVKVSKTEWRTEHRVVMEQKLGRPLLPEERVHHKNCNKADNRPENLELWTGSKKDPPGQRLIDKVKNLARELPLDDRKELIVWLQDLKD